MSYSTPVTERSGPDFHLRCRCCHTANGTSSSSPVALFPDASLLLGFRPLAKTACALEFFLTFPFDGVVVTGGDAVAERERDGAPPVAAAF